MKIETKFKPGDWVYFLRETKLERDVINSASIGIDNNSVVTINYFFFDKNGICTMRKEGELFVTTEEFVAQLLEEKLIEPTIDLDNIFPRS